MSALNSFLSRWLIVLIPLSFVAGYAAKGWMPHLKWTAPHMLFTIMFASTWGLRWRDFARIGRYRKVYPLGMIGQFLVIPAVAYAIAHTMFGITSDYGVGQLCVAASPAAISTIIWSSITGGDVALGVLLVGTHVLTVPFVAPLMLKLLIGKAVHVPIKALFVKLMWSVFIPTILAVSIYEKRPNDRIKPGLSAWAKLGMLYMIVLNTSVALSSVPFNTELLKVLAAMGIQVATSYAAGFLLGIITSSPRDVRITLSYFLGMKNNGAALVMALSGFSPAATLPAAVTIMWQQPLASIFDRLWRRLSRPKTP